MSKINYSEYECPFAYLEKEIIHELHGPSNFAEDKKGPSTRVWCLCGFRGPNFYLDPEQLRLKKKKKTNSDIFNEISLKAYSKKGEKTFFDEMNGIIEHAEWPKEFHFMCLDLAARADHEIDKAKTTDFVPGILDEPVMQNARQITYTAVFAAVMQGYTGRMSAFFETSDDKPTKLLEYAHRAAMSAVEGSPK